jgi:hypothetical protein
MANNGRVAAFAAQFAPPAGTWFSFLGVNQDVKVMLPWRLQNGLANESPS